MSDPCFRCGGMMILTRTAHVGDVPLPRDVELPTCIGCGESWIDDKTTEELAKVIAQTKRRRAPKVAGPWKEAWIDEGGTKRRPACRKTPDGQMVVWDRRSFHDDLTIDVVEIHAWACDGDVVHCLSREEADAHLVRIGWILVND